MKTENTGWQCPNCLVVYAPIVDKCECSVIPILTKDEFKASSKVLNSKDWNYMVGTVTSSTAHLCFGYISESPNGICSKCGQPEWYHLNICYT